LPDDDLFITGVPPPPLAAVVDVSRLAEGGVGGVAVALPWSAPGVWGLESSCLVGLLLWVRLNWVRLPLFRSHSSSSPSDGLNCSKTDKRKTDDLLSQRRANAIGFSSCAKMKYSAEQHSDLILHLNICKINVPLLQIVHELPKICLCGAVMPTMWPDSLERCLTESDRCCTSKTLHMRLVEKC
jgi:hypothetical protein